MALATPEPSASISRLAAIYRPTKRGADPIRLVVDPRPARQRAQAFGVLPSMRSHSEIAEP